MCSDGHVVDTVTDVALAYQAEHGASIVSTWSPVTMRSPANPTSWATL